MFQKSKIHRIAPNAAKLMQHQGIDPSYLQGWRMEGGVARDVPHSVGTPENNLFQDRQGAKPELARELLHKMRMEWNALSPLSSSAC